MTNYLCYVHSHHFSKCGPRFDWLKCKHIPFFCCFFSKCKALFLIWCEKESLFYTNFLLDLKSWQRVDWFARDSLVYHHLLYPWPKLFPKSILAPCHLLWSELSKCHTAYHKKVHLMVRELLCCFLIRNGFDFWHVIKTLCQKKKKTLKKTFFRKKMF